MNDPGFAFEYDSMSASTYRRDERPTKTKLTVQKTSISQQNHDKVRCIVHKSDHSLNDCRAFRHMAISERRNMLKQHGICFKCCAGKHIFRDCNQQVSCTECKSTDHTTAMHIFKNRDTNTNSYTGHGGEKTSSSVVKNVTTSITNTEGNQNVNSKCTQICQNAFGGKSCAKIVLVNVWHALSDKPPVRVYAIIDEQSNCSLARKELFDMFDLNTEQEHYSLTSCSGKVSMSCRRDQDFIVESLDKDHQINLPTLIECDSIPNNRHEIPTNAVTNAHSHLKCIAPMIPPLDEDAEILLLIGRDALTARHILEQILGQHDQPFAQKLKQRWVIVGETCLNGTHLPKSVNAMKTYVQPNGRASILKPCDNVIRVSDKLSSKYLFELTPEDNKLGMSVEDKKFIDFMSSEMTQDDNNSWTAPLPFKESRGRLPNNYQQALNRAKIFDNSLHKDPVKRQHVLDFMRDIIENGNAERAPKLQGEECWYLPLFGVYHPKKKDRIRVVFDSSAKYQGISLNDALITGPNLINNLVGVLMRFRQEKIAVTADIRQMFYSFNVREDHRDYLRFLWHEGNDLDKDLVEYRMTVHVFGNSPSPAVATFGLHKTAEKAEAMYGSDVKAFVEQNFYVDDALYSAATVEQAVDLVKRTQLALKSCGNLHLHKISSNSSEVLAAFDTNDLAKNLKSVDIKDECLPMQRSLGVSWTLQSDSFTFQVSAENKTFTRRGVLSVINGLYDPLRFAAPVTLAGKLILRETMDESYGWDETLPIQYQSKWETWKNSLEHLEQVKIPRHYSTQLSASSNQQNELFIFSDASEKAIAAVAYIRTTDKDGNQQLGFVCGKAKVAPKHGHTIPRLELCAAVLAVEIYEIIRDEINLRFDQVRFFTDSKVVLGYIYNETKRFFIYVGNRIDRIRKSTQPQQWSYVPTSKNPADDATRSVLAKELSQSKWLLGPVRFLCNQDNDTESTTEQETNFSLVLPEEDKEVRVAKTQVDGDAQLGSARFERFSSWNSLLKAINLLKQFIATRMENKHRSTSDTSNLSAQETIIKTVQKEVFSEECKALSANQPLSRKSKILNLNPFLDDKGLLRVGGRLTHANIHHNEMKPLVIPKHHIATLIARHIHERVSHQGRHITEGALRLAGFWLIGGKQLVTSLIYKCVKCRKLRGREENPKMADLPFDRLDPAPPFSYIGVDVFGPWTITTRKTRGGQAQNKRWAVMFTCLVIRAVHIEIIEVMSTACFINKLRRFCPSEEKSKLSDRIAEQTLSDQLVTLRQMLLILKIDRSRIIWCRRK